METAPRRRRTRNTNTGTSTAIERPTIPQNDTHVRPTANFEDDPGTGSPEFRPTRGQMADFESYVTAMHAYCAAQNYGIAKVIPPDDWIAELPDIRPQLRLIVIEAPIRQPLSWGQVDPETGLGAEGVYAQNNVSLPLAYSPAGFAAEGLTDGIVRPTYLKRTPVLLVPPPGSSGQVPTIGDATDFGGSGSNGHQVGHQEDQQQRCFFTSLQQGLLPRSAELKASMARPAAPKKRRRQSMLRPSSSSPPRKPRISGSGSGSQKRSRRSGNSTDEDDENDDDDDGDDGDDHDEDDSLLDIGSPIKPPTPRSQCTPNEFPMVPSTSSDPRSHNNTTDSPSMHVDPDKASQENASKKKKRTNRKQLGGAWLDFEAEYAQHDRPPLFEDDLLTCRFTPDEIRALEERYWWMARPTRRCRAPIYGAGVTTSLWPSDTVPADWNTRNLDKLLAQLHRGAHGDWPGVNTPFLYFGSWRAAFPWHTEDTELYAINYLHFGAVKVWYSVGPDDRAAFEGVMAELYPDEAAVCPQFLRHKRSVVNPEVLHTRGVRTRMLVQAKNEFVITFPSGYHSGWNAGFNCAEAVNFGLPDWFEAGKAAAHCRCGTQGDNTVEVDVHDLEQRYHAAFPHTASTAHVPPPPTSSPPTSPSASFPLERPVRPSPSSAVAASTETSGCNNHTGLPMERPALTGPEYPYDFDSVGPDLAMEAQRFAAYAPFLLVTDVDRDGSNSHGHRHRAPSPVRLMWSTLRAIPESGELTAGSPTSPSSLSTVRSAVWNRVIVVDDDGLSDEEEEEWELAGDTDPDDDDDGSME
ncbi:JmjC domain, hydroxylase-domain-containing protein [Blastocladiella britannica]|nr:JmjC domain, hydroxylase-domain-containing protein [Blastocladiella britannica]